MIAWFVTLLISVSRPGAPIFYPDAKETKEETEARYLSIATDLATVVSDPNEVLLFDGEGAPAKTGAILLAIAAHESHFRKDVDEGLGAHAQGDGGRSWCLAQINLGTKNAEGKTTGRFVLQPDGKFKIVYNEGTLVGWGGEDLVSDRTKCFRAELAIVRRSFKCGGSKEGLLSFYASGSCKAGRKESETRMGLGLRWISGMPEFTDPSEAIGNSPNLSM